MVDFNPDGYLDPFVGHPCDDETCCYNDSGWCPNSRSEVGHHGDECNGRAEICPNCGEPTEDGYCESCEMDMDDPEDMEEGMV